MPEEITQELTIETPVPTNGQTPEPEWEEDEDENALRDYLFSPACDDRPEIVVPVPEWRRRVLIKALTGTEREAFYKWQQAQTKDDEKYTMRLRWYLVSNYVLHPRTRKPFLKAADMQPFNNQKNGAVLEILSITVQQLSRLDGTTFDEAKKNLDLANSTGTDNLSSDSTQEA